jgi:hypothetical protein
MPYGSMFPCAHTPIAANPISAAKNAAARSLLMMVSLSDRENSMPVRGNR